MSLEAALDAITNDRRSRRERCSGALQRMRAVKRQATAVLCCASSVALLTGRVHAQGGPPLITDDPGTPGAGRWEINSALTVERLRSETLFEAPIVDINYGLGERIQLKYEIPWVFLDVEGDDARNGLGNSQIGVKYRFLDEERHGVSMSIYPQLSFNNPTSSDERGLVDPGSELALPFQVARRAGPVELGLELGYVLMEHGEDEWSYGLAGALPLTEGLELLGEVHGFATSDFEDDVLVFNLGGALELNESVSLLFSAGRSFRDSSTMEPELLGYFGLQFRV